MSRIKSPTDPCYRKPTEVHDSPCEKCPSYHYKRDPEAQQFIDWCKSGEMDPFEAVFSCAWRPEKICYGVAKNVGYTPPDRAR